MAPDEKALKKSPIHKALSKLTKCHILADSRCNICFINRYRAQKAAGDRHHWRNRDYCPYPLAAKREHYNAWI